MYAINQRNQAAHQVSEKYSPGHQNDADGGKQQDAPGAGARTAVTPLRCAGSGL